MSQIRRVFTILCVAALVSGVMIASPLSLSAQDTDDVAGGQFVAIHEGTCDSLTDVSVHDIGEASLPGTDDDDQDEEARGSLDAVPVLIAEETIETTFGDLLDEGDHALVVHAGESEMGTIVACGAIGGVVDDGRLVFGLLPVGDSGIRGVADLDEDEEGFLGLGDDEVRVRVYLLVEQAIGVGGAAGTPTPDLATPVDGATAPAEEDVEDATATAEVDEDDVGTPEAEG